MRVLIADDHPIHRQLLADLFALFGCEVTTACDGAEAVATPGVFDLVCLDRHMPVMGGIEAARRLRGRAFLVACTSDPEGLGIDFDAVLPKPISCQQIAEVVQTAAQGRWADGAISATSARA